MSRNPTNKGLSQLCKKIGFQIADLACRANTSRENIHRYSTGRRHFPILEKKLADIFKLSVPQLRKKLGLGGCK